MRQYAALLHVHGCPSAEGGGRLSNITIVGEECAASFLAFVMVYDVCSFQQGIVVGRIVSEDEGFCRWTLIVYCELKLIGRVSCCDVTFDDSL